MLLPLLEQSTIDAESVINLDCDFEDCFDEIDREKL